MGDQSLRISKKYLQQISTGVGCQTDVLACKNLKVVHAQKDLLRCDFIISDNLSDDEGCWQAGAIAILIEIIGTAAILSFDGEIKPAFDFSISYHSSAKIQEEVEVEAKIMSQRGKLTSVITEMRRKENGELIALGKMWAASSDSAGRGSQFWMSINNKPSSTPSKL